MRSKAEPETTLDLHGTQDGETPIDLDAAQFLLPAHSGIRTLNELNELEALNVADAYIWLNDESPSTADLLDQFFLREVHRRMFCNVWTWAGKLRQRETNISVDPSQIQERWQVVLGDCLYWTEHETYPLVEIGVRFHHRMVAIHPFTNGNGRHARLSANKLAESLGSGGDL